MYFLAQVVILARIIPDETQARSSTIGINLLVDLLRNSRSDEILALAADFVACLSHTRAGKYVLLSLLSLSIQLELLPVSWLLTENKKKSNLTEDILLCTWDIASSNIGSNRWEAYDITEMIFIFF